MLDTEAVSPCRFCVLPCVAGGRFFSVGRSAASSVESVPDVLLESVESDVRRCIVGLFESSDEADFGESAVDEGGAGVAAELSPVVSEVSLESARLFITGRSGSSEAVVVAGVVVDVLAGVASPDPVESDAVESVLRVRVGRDESSFEAVVVVVEEFPLVAVSALSESVRRRIVGREESSVDAEVVELVEGAGVVEAAVEPESSEPPESVRRRMVGFEESSAEAVVELELSVLFPSFGRVPPLATTCGSGPLFVFPAYVGPCDADLNNPYPSQPSSNCVTLLPSRCRSYAN
jgi:hypothetical protein